MSKKRNSGNIVIKLDLEKILHEVISRKAEDPNVSLPEFGTAIDKHEKIENSILKNGERKN